MAPPSITTLPQLFTQSQHTLSSHRKLQSQLHALFLHQSSITTPSADGETIRLTGEKAFGEGVREVLVGIVGVRKGEEKADRVGRFLAGFVGVALDYDSNNNKQDDEEEEDEETPTTRLISQLMAFLIRGFTAKNKTVRFRSVWLVALLVNCLGEIDDDQFHLLLSSLTLRTRDKESSIRVQAVVALAKLQGADEDPSSDEEEESEAESDDEESDEEEYKEVMKKGKKEKVGEEEEKSVVRVLIECLVTDPAAEVRRATLINLLPTPHTLPYLLSRTLDLDPQTRKAIYAHVLPGIPFGSLSLSQVKSLIRTIHVEREPSVSKAGRLVLVGWVDSIPGGLAELLEILLGEEEAEWVGRMVLDLRGDLAEAGGGDEEFYESLTPTTVLLLRLSLAHLRKTSSPVLAEKEPSITKLVELIHSSWIGLLVVLEGEEKDEEEELERGRVLEGLLGVAEEGEYWDEMGRRGMFELMRTLLSHPLLPLPLVPHCLDVILKGGIAERDFVRIVVEIVHVLRNDSRLVTSESEGGGDDEEEEDNGREGRGRERGPKHAERRKELDLKCLGVTKAMLERVVGAIIAENSMVHGLVVSLIVPAVRSKDYEIRSEGLLCLGLGCLLDKSMALDSFELLARQSQATEGRLRIKLMQTLFDLLVLHGIHFGTQRNFGADVIIGFLLNSLEQEEADVSATAVVGITKLMLAGMVTDHEILSRLVLLYFASETADNQELRQCLSYFFPVYSYASPQNQRGVSKVLLPTLILLKGVYDDLTDKTTMVAPLQIGLQLVDWTDPQNSVETKHVKGDDTIHFDLAVDMIKLLYTEEQKDERKLLCQLLPKLHIPEEINHLKIKGLLTLTSSLKLNRPLADAVSKNALVRFENSLIKTFGEKLDALTDEEIAEAEFLNEAHAFIQSVLQDDEEGEDVEEADEDEEEEEEVVEEEGEDDEE